MLRFSVLIRCLVLIALIGECAAAPFCEITNVFEEKTDGFASYRIPGIVVTSRGTVLAYCEARKYSSADWGEIEIHMRRSTDGGVTFSAPRHVAHLGPRLPRNPANADQPDGKAVGRPGEQTVNNPVAIAARDGTIHLLYCVEYMRCFHIHSTDDGLTWSPPQEITAAFEPFRRTVPWTIIATGPGHGIELASGRLLVPVWIATSDGSPHGGGSAAVISSDDQGETWHAGDIVVPNDGAGLQPSESSVAELGDGRVMLVARNHGPPNRKLAAFSEDGGTKWTRPAYVEDLVEPICMSGLVEFRSAPTAPRWLLFSNPNSLSRRDNGERPGGRRDRLNLTVRMSDDGGRTWPVSRSLEPGPSGYSDLAVLPDGTVLCLFERGRGMPAAGEKVWPYAFITLARFNESWLRGADAGHYVTAAGDTSLEWRPLPALPDPLGFAGPFVGSHRGAILVAGGANFPVADGQDRWAAAKRWHDDVWAFAGNAAGGGEWVAQPPLPRPMGYGASASTPFGVLCIGGEDGTRMFDSVTLVSWDPESRRLASRSLPPLPEPMAFGGAAAVGSIVYVACGQPGPSPAGPTASCYRLDLGGFDPDGDDPGPLEWEKVPDVPGGPRTHAIVVARQTDTGPRVCVLSGRRPDPAGGKGAIEPLRDAYEFDPVAWDAAGRPAAGEQGWRRLADMPAARMAGVAVPTSTGGLAVLSGDDGRLWTKTDLLKDTHPGFPRASLVYDPVQNAWSTGGLVPSCQVTTTAVPWGDGHAVVTGEVRPRVRTPTAWLITSGSIKAAGPPAAVQ
jgi:sialidase-1